MIPIYLYLLLGSVSVPMLFSIFYMDLIKDWKSFSISTTIVAIVFLIWDAIFTHLGVWSFNADYSIGFNILKMPIEEWLFFFVIPFCSLFIHFSFQYILPDLKLARKSTQIIAIVFIVIATAIFFTNLSKAYTAVNYSFLAVTLIIGVLYYVDLLRRFFITFIIILIPFFIVNGILTGVLTPSPIVSYDDAENLGIRLITIPIEDIGYAFTMLFGNLMIFEWLKGRRRDNCADLI